MYRRSKQARLLTGGLIGALPVTTPGDEYWNDVTLLLDGSSLTDASTASPTITPSSTSPDAGDTVAPKWGSSLEFTGGFQSASPEYLNITLDQNLGASSEPFTVETWVRPDVIATNSSGIFQLTGSSTLSASSNVVAAAPSVAMAYVSAGGQDKWRLYGPGDSNHTDVYEASAAPTVGTWTHVAAVYNGTDVRFYANGVLLFTKTSPSIPAGGFGVCIVGGFYNDDYILDGRLEDFRVTKGVARYTAAFTPPTASFLTNAPVVGRRGVGSVSTALAVDTFATLDPTKLGGSTTLSNGNLSADFGTTEEKLTSTQSITSGKYYAEYRADAYGGSRQDLWIEVNDQNTGASSYHVTYASDTGSVYRKPSGVLSGPFTYGDTFTTVGDIIGVAIDADIGAVWFSKNGVWQAGATAAEIAAGNTTNAAASGLTGSYWFGCHDGTSLDVGTEITANFGQDATFNGTESAGTYTDANGLGEFQYDPPAGFTGLYTTISGTLRTRGYLGEAPAGRSIYPEEHFKAVTYTGAGGTPSITGVGFRPDFVWIKNRDQTDTHVITDVVRGVGKTLTSETAAVEATDTDTVTSFDADGFSLGADVKVNTNTEDYVAWCLKAGGAVSANNNTDGSITSTVSANVDAGFSVVKWTGNETANTVGHGLSSPPELIMFKATQAISNWVVGSSYNNNTSGWNIQLYLNLTNSLSAVSSSPFNNTAPTNSTFSVGNSDATNDTGHMIAYCFHSVPGFSKVGSYTGDGGTNNYVELGFRPAFVMIKNTGNNTNSWGMFDNARDPDNGVDKTLYADFAGAENSGTDYLQFDADGFTVINNANFVNQSGNTLIYLAFAESNTLSGPDRGMLTLYDAYVQKVTYPVLTINYLVIAGGGGGGNNGGGGGGAGGYRSSVSGESSGGGASAESPITGAIGVNYTVTVGAGGAGSAIANGTRANGADGGASVFDTITTTGGGGGSSGGFGTSTFTGRSGGSGGGGSNYNTGPSSAAARAGGAGTTNEGYAGGAGNNVSGVNSGGGGGAGGVGADGQTGSIGGVGGAGITSSITGTAVTRASGGSGYQQTTATSGGGGETFVAATANTGGGGGAYAAGGSGVVILRYPSEYTISVGAGLTSNTIVDGSYKVTTFTAGSDTVYFN